MFNFIFFNKFINGVLSLSYNNESYITFIIPTKLCLFRCNQYTYIKNKPNVKYISLIFIDSSYK